MLGGRWSVVARVLLTAVGCWLSAGRPLAAQAAPSTPHGFISTRYGTATSSVLLVGYTIGPVTPMMALAQDPHSASREELAGVLRIQPLGRHLGLTYGVAGAKTDEAWFGELWLAPSITWGRLRSDARFKLYIPLEPAGARELSMSPASLVVDLSRRVVVGAAAVWVTEQGSSHELGMGPRLGLRIPKGSIMVDGLLGVKEWDSEVRVSFTTTY